MSVKGKTYEEIYGAEKAAELKALRRKNAISQMKIQRKGKTFIEIHGEEKAKTLSKEMSKRTSGKGNPNYQGGKITITCKNCNKEFKVCEALKDVRKNGSQKCHIIIMLKQVEFKCTICHKKFSRKESWGESKYCSWKCYHSTMWQKGNPNWQGGKSYQPYPIEWTEELRFDIRKRDNFTCQLCNMEETTSLEEIGRILSVHHIDYDKENCQEINLVTLCVKCHIKTNNNRDYWTKYFSKQLELV